MSTEEDRAKLVAKLDELFGKISAGTVEGFIIAYEEGDMIRGDRVGVRHATAIGLANSAHVLFISQLRPQPT